MNFKALKFLMEIQRNFNVALFIKAHKITASVDGEMCFMFLYNNDVNKLAKKKRKILIL